ncbi:MAG: hypothetical protein WA160_00315 [Pseudobdellovibrio sp.]
MVRSSLIVLIIALYNFAFAGSLENCLEPALKMAHRLNRLESIQTCFEQNKTKMVSESCFSTIAKIQTHDKSIELTERLNSLCFYEVSQFKTIKNCLDKTNLFKITMNHDEGVFECYRQFQSTLNQKQCLAVSMQLKYPAKKEYLENHCKTNIE